LKKKIEIDVRKKRRGEGVGVWPKLNNPFAKIGRAQLKLATERKPKKYPKRKKKKKNLGCILVPYLVFFGFLLKL